MPATKSVVGTSEQGAKLSRLLALWYQNIPCLYTQIEDSQFPCSVMVYGIVAENTHSLSFISYTAIIFNYVTKFVGKPLRLLVATLTSPRTLVLDWLTAVA